MRIEHIAVYYKDLEKARDFFIKYFNATSNGGYYNPDKKFRSFFLSFESGARIEIMNKPELSDNIEPEHYGYAILISAWDVQMKLTHLQKDSGKMDIQS